MTKQIADKIAAHIKFCLPLSHGYTYHEEDSSMQMILFKASDDFNGFDDAVYIEKDCSDVAKEVERKFKVNTSVTRTREQGYMNIIKLEVK